MAFPPAFKIRGAKGGVKPSDGRNVSVPQAAAIFPAAVKPSMYLTTRQYCLFYGAPAVASDFLSFLAALRTRRKVSGNLQRHKSDTHTQVTIGMWPK